MEIHTGGNSGGNYCNVFCVSFRHSKYSEESSVSIIIHHCGIHKFCFGDKINYMKNSVKAGNKKTYAFIDASNLFYGGARSLGWKIDYKKLLKERLNEKYSR